MPKQHIRQICKPAVSLPFPARGLNCGAGAIMGYQKLREECNCAGRIAYWLHSLHSIEKHIAAIPFGPKSEWKAVRYGAGGELQTGRYIVPEV